MIQDDPFWYGKWWQFIGTQSTPFADEAIWSVEIDRSFDFETVG